MSKRWRNSIKKRAKAKREPLPLRQVGYLPANPPPSSGEYRKGEKHFERRRRNLRGQEHEVEAA